MNKTLEQIGLLGIIPVVAVGDKERAAELAQTLCESGLPILEVTFRAVGATDAIERVATKFPQMLVGAGTVLTIDQARTAIDAGARFVVSPGFNLRIVEFCLSKSTAVIPGIITPTEVQYAIVHGLDVVKFFPAEASGGVEYLKAMAAPFDGVRYVPTGGIDESNLLAYLRLPQVLACGGTWMVPTAHIQSGNFAEIAKLTRKAVARMLGFELRHIGMNMPDAGDAKQTAAAIERIFNFEVRDAGGALFVGNQFEVLKQPNLGAKGHIAMVTNFIDRAVAHLALKGIGIKPETRNVQDGKLRTVYLDLELGGFAVHLVQA